MKFTKDILANLKDSGADICLYSTEFSQLLRDYSRFSFSEFSTRLYYFWKDNKRPIPLSIVLKIMADKKLKEVNVDSFSVRGGNRVIPPDENKVFFYYFLGLVLGDGCLICTRRDARRSSYTIQISFRYKKEADKIKRLVKKLFKWDSSIYVGRGCFDLCIYSKPLVLILNRKYQIPMGVKYSSIKVPNMVWVANKEKKKAFLKGMFDSDGNMYLHRGRKSVQLRQKSSDFLKQLNVLFKQVGITFRDPYYDKANNSWVLWSSKKELVDNFIRQIINFKAMGP